MSSGDLFACSLAPSIIDTCEHAQTFYEGAEDLNSGAPACVAVALLTELQSLSSNPFTLKEYSTLL